MKKKVLLSLLAAMALSVTCSAAATNPFIEVPSDSWEYKSIVGLADAGLIQGVNGTYFAGQSGINRYEAAEMTAKALVHVDQATPEQRTEINKLASEYSKEISSFFEVREPAAKNTLSSTTISGDYRLRYRFQKNAFTRDASDVTNNHFAYRMRVRANMQLNDSTTAVLGVSTNNKSFDDETEASTQTGSVYTDAAYIATKLKDNVNIKVGRWPDFLLETGTNALSVADSYALGVQYYDAFDGIQAQYKGNNFTATGGYGQFKEGAYYNGYYKNPNGQKMWFNNSISSTSSPLSGHSLEGIKTVYLQLEGKINNAGGGIYYHSFSDNDAAAQNLSGAYGGYLSYGYNKWHLITNYEKVKKITQLPKDQNAALWVTKLTYGHVSLKKNTWDTWLSYVDADPNFIYGSTGSWRNYNLLDNVKSWEIGADYTVAKNVVFSLFQTFNSKLKDDYYGNSSPGEETRAQLWYFF